MLKNQVPLSDELIMNISGGISSVGLAGETGKVREFYLWPNYPNSPIEPARGVVRRTDTNILYRKATPEVMEEAITNLRMSQRQEPSVKQLHTSSVYPPGTLFEARV
jgi:hypothetical protein